MAPAASPPTENPCRMRRRINSAGAATPIAAYVGRTPMPAVATLISMITKTSIFCLPILSPRMPQTTAPSGRTKNEIA